MFYNENTTGGGQIDADGRFQVLEPGLKPGRYHIAISPPSAFTTPPMPGRMRTPPEYPEFPKKYRSPICSGFMEVVENTDNVFTFAMVSQLDVEAPLKAEVATEAMSEKDTSATAPVRLRNPVANEDMPVDGDRPERQME